MSDTPSSPKATPATASSNSETKAKEPVDQTPTSKTDESQSAPVPSQPAEAAPSADAKSSDASEQPAEKTVAPIQLKVQPDPKAGGYYWGTGRRKRSIARVRIKPGSGKFLINKREIDGYFCALRDRSDIVAPLKVTKTFGQFDVFVNLKGGGTTGQAGAVMLGLSRALLKTDPDYLDVLRSGNFLTRDPRKVERKKPGQPGARKRFQFSKR